MKLSGAGLDPHLQSYYQEPEDIPYVAPTGPYRPPRLLERDQKNQLHLAGHCATYIFASNGQVISIHFDHSRDQLFYQGHNLANIPIDREIEGYLSEFQNKLALDPKGRTLHSAYSLLVHTLLSK